MNCWKACQHLKLGGCKYPKCCPPRPKAKVIQLVQRGIPRALAEAMTQDVFKGPYK